MRSSDYRAAARKSLDGQWGTFALLMLSSGVLSMIVTGGFGLIFGSDNSLVSTLTQLLLTFAFGYGIFYASLYAVRGGKVKVGMIFSVFNGGRYLPLLLVNFAEWLVGLVSSFVLALPFIGILGFGVISTMLFAGGSSSLISGVVGIGGFSAMALLTLVFIIILAGVSTLIDGYFQIVVLARLDFPEMKFGDVFSYAFTLLKGRLWDLFVLQLSFIGWYLLGIFVIPLLWVVPYKIVAISEFYDVAKENNELKETI